MLKQFIEFVESVLPSVPQESANAAKEAINQINCDKYEFVTTKLLPELSQGDMISEIPFFYLDGSGVQKNFKSKGMIISTSCHIDQKDLILIAPAFSVEDFVGDITSLKRNQIYDYMYLSNISGKDYFVDFSSIGSYNKSMLIKGFEVDKIHRVASLSQLGYYFLIIKLTVFLMRREDSTTLKHRSDLSTAY